MVQTTTGVGDEADPSGEAVPRRIRLFVRVFLAAFLVCGFAAIEAWPLTGWHLFSALRHGSSESWLAATVDETGAEAPIPFGSLPRSYRWGPNLLTLFPKLPVSRQEAICEAWVDAVRAGGTEVDEIRIYRVQKVVSDRVGDRGAPIAGKTLRYTCGDGSVQIEGGAS